MAIILFDNNERQKLYPLTLTRAVADIQTGVYTFKERWQLLSNQSVYICTQPYLQCLYEAVPLGTHTWIDASAIINDERTVQQILSLNEGAAVFDSKGFIAAKLTIENIAEFLHSPDAFVSKIYQVQDVKRLKYLHEIFQHNHAAIERDFLLATKDKTSAKLSSTNNVLAAEKIFIEEDVQAEFVTINATTGPVYIAKNAVLMEGSLIRGPFVLGENAVLKMGSKIYGATTISHDCTCGGEIKNVVMHAYSNKAHEGYLGDSVIGSWCNLGAGTSNSNVKNTASNVKLWNDYENDFIKAGLKCGLIMGDYSRTAINTSVNTGTVAGVCCNIFGEGLSPKVIESFSWGMHPSEKYELEKALNDIDNWKKMKHQLLSNEEREVLQYIFEQFSK
ncbi:MAG: putative sugar nucleotidyl transferase [Ilyomonas sp.]